MKFKHLCNAGFEASLQLQGKNGHANVSLEVEFGSLTSTLNAFSDATPTLKP